MKLSNNMWILRTRVDLTLAADDPALFGTAKGLEDYLRDNPPPSYAVEKGRTWLEEAFDLPPRADREMALQRAANECAGFLSAINRLIEAYRVARRDPFVAPISYHTIEKLYQFASLDGEGVSLPTRIGKGPSVFRAPWMPDPSAQDLSQLEAFLAGRAVPFHRSQLMQARNYVERGETRAAIMEGYGAFETCVQAKIGERLRANGKTDEEISECLQRNEGFKDRDTLLKRLTGKNLKHDNDQLSQEVLDWKKRIRHSVIHSDCVPSADEAARACDCFEKAVRWIDSL
jgi:hypothetical protein